MKRKIIVLIFILCIFSLSLMYYLCNKSVMSNSVVENKEVINKEINNQEVTDVEDNSKELLDQEQNNEVEEKTITPTKENTSQVKKKKNTQEVTKNKNETQVATQNETQVATQNKTETQITKEPEKESGPWDKLGMTEYQYYNEPMYKWEHVDFSIDKYGSESAALNACLNHGDNYQPYLNGEVLYHCSTVTSASGKYLGEMFHTEKLTQ